MSERFQCRYPGRESFAEVAERCGFCNPAYSAYVLKKYVHCTPREFARRPSSWRPHKQTDSRNVADFSISFPKLTGVQKAETWVVERSQWLAFPV